MSLIPILAARKTQQGANVKLASYISRVTALGGILRSRTFANELIALNNQIPESNILLSVSPMLGVVENVIDVKTVNVAKLINLKSGNDVVQATQLNQPTMGGIIVPNEPKSLVNGNGQNKYLTHTPISFSSMDAWAIEVVLNDNHSGDTMSNSYFAGNAITSRTLIGSKPDGYFFIRNESGQSVSLPGGVKGKTCVYVFVAYNNVISLYVNGILKGFIALSSEFVFNTLLMNSYFTGKIYSYTIFNKALNQTEITNRYAMLRRWFPEKITVTIGSQVWCTNNEQVVCTPRGNVIAEVTANATWANSQVLYDNAYAATSGTVEQKTYAGCKAAAMWRSPNNDPALAVIYGKHYNKFAAKLLDMDIVYYNNANPTALWGYDAPARVQLTTLSSIGGNAAKKDGALYWTTANGSNVSGMSLVGSGYTAANGTYTEAILSTGLLCKDADFVRIVKDTDDTFNEVAITTEGYPIRLIKV